MGGGLSRARQRVSEAMKRRSASKYDEDWDDEVLMVANTGAGCEKLAKKAREHASIFWQPDFASGRTVYLMEGVGEAASGLAATVLGTAGYAGTLAALAKAGRGLAVEEQNYGRDVDQVYAGPLRNWLLKKDEPFRKALEEMGWRRLEMDDAGWAAKDLPADSAHIKRVKAEAAARRHAEAMERVQSYVEAIREDHLEHLRLLAEFLKLQAAFHDNSAAELKVALTSLGLDKKAYDFNAK